MSYGAIEREEAFCAHMEVMVTLFRAVHKDHVRQSSCPFCAALATAEQLIDESRNEGDDYAEHEDDPAPDDDADSNEIEEGGSDD